MSRDLDVPQQLKKGDGTLYPKKTKKALDDNEARMSLICLGCMTDLIEYCLVILMPTPQGPMPLTAQPPVCPHCGLALLTISKPGSKVIPATRMPANFKMPGVT